MYRLVTGLAGAHAASSFLPDALDLLCRDAGLNISFEICDTALENGFDIAAAVEDRARRGWAGISITDPHEFEAANAIAAELSPEAKKTGAANVLIFGTPVKGHNTNYTGFINCWRSVAGDSGPGAVALAGAGGLGRAIALALNDLGAADIAIFDENQGLAEEAATLIGGATRAVHHGEWRAVTRNADGLVNATMRGMGGSIEIAFPESAVFGQHWLFDAVYRPINTRLIRLARESGIYCISGFDMLLHTAVATFAGFTGITPDHELALKSLRSLQRPAA